MTEERIRFARNDARYDAAFSLQHLVRYAAVREHCRGKRVLDAACGEGYGTYLMAQWGAKEVVGVDISSDAIGAASSLFEHPLVRFIEGDVLDVDTLLSEEPRFDLIVSFETIEHVREPTRFLSAMQVLTAPGGSIVISCPNDYAGFDPDQVNEFHLRKYTFEEFRDLTTPVLGEADQWLLGTPSLAQIHYAFGSELAEGVHERPTSILALEALDNAVLLPSEPSMRASKEDCVHYTGVWGAKLPANAALAPMSYKSFVGPWRTAEYLQAELERIKAADDDAEASGTIERENALAQIAEWKKAAEDLQNDKSALLTEVARIKAEAEELHETKKNLHAEMSEWKSGTESLQADKSALLNEVARVQAETDELRLDGRNLRAQINELRSGAERLAQSNATSQETIQDLRRRVLFHGEDRARLNLQVSKAEQLNQQLWRDYEHLRNRVPELESQLNERSAVASDLHRELDQARAIMAEWQRFSGTRSYRLIRAYYGFYGIPIIGRVTAWLQRNFGRALRIFRR